jgi:hypothetical protein
LLNIQRERELAAMTPEDRERASRELFGKLKSRRKKVLTPEEKEAKRQKLNAYQRERAARKRLKQSL